MIFRDRTCLQIKQQSITQCKLKMIRKINSKAIMQMWTVSLTLIDRSISKYFKSLTKTIQVKYKLFRFMISLTNLIKLLSILTLEGAIWIYKTMKEIAWILDNIMVILGHHQIIKTKMEPRFHEDWTRKTSAKEE